MGVLTRELQGECGARGILRRWGYDVMRSDSKTLQILRTAVTYKTTKTSQKKEYYYEQKTIQKIYSYKTKSITKTIRRYMLQPFFSQDMAKCNFSRNNLLITLQFINYFK